MPDRPIETPDEGGATAANSLGEKKTFTTGEVARLCKVSQQTIIRCFDAGRLGGFRVPGSRFRRIPRAELIRFMHENGIPTSGTVPDRGTTAEGACTRVLVVSPGVRNRPLALRVKTALDARGSIESQVVGDAFEAGRSVETFRPHVLALDPSVPGLDAEQLRTRLRDDESLAGMRLLVLGNQRPSPAPGRGESDASRAALPDTDGLAERIRTALKGGGG